MPSSLTVLKFPGKWGVLNKGSFVAHAGHDCDRHPYGNPTTMSHEPGNIRAAAAGGIPCDLPLRGSGLFSVVLRWRFSRSLCQTFGGTFIRTGRRSGIFSQAGERRWRRTLRFRSRWTKFCSLIHSHINRALIGTSNTTTYIDLQRALLEALGRRSPSASSSAQYSRRSFLRSRVLPRRLSW